MVHGVPINTRMRWTVVRTSWRPGCDLRAARAGAAVSSRAPTQNTATQLATARRMDIGTSQGARGASIEPRQTSQ
jgi:hypothetical protein